MLTPVDVWLFRDGKSFDAGSDHFARSVFPPFPTVLQGAIRSHHLRVKGVDLSDPQAIAACVGTATNFGALRLRGPFVARYEDNRWVRYFPTPADAVPARKDGWVVAATPRAAADDDAQTCHDSVLPMLLFPPEGTPLRKQAEESWMSEDALRDYLAGCAAPTCSASDLFTVEHRYGVGIQPGRNRVADAERGLLYAVAFTRTRENVGLYLEVSGYDGWPSRGVMRIGGEGHGAYFEQTAPLPWHSAPNPLPERFKLCFLTPTYFEAGWRPDRWDKFFAGHVQLVTVALRRYEMRGGFDLASRSPKPARRFVPAGSVYYFQSADSARLRDDLVNQAITDFAPEIGFGQFWIAPW
ncbi:MAG: hypothetical protein NZ693_12090 [Thermoflexales bacterium]|nr:hypothetical protein [Thermoflexales bacterium]